jgi:heat shock protein HslJ
MPRFLIVTSLLLVAGCTQRAEPDAAQANETAAPAAKTAEATVPDLNGAWRVTKLDGRPVGSMVVSFDSGKARIAAGCNYRAWSFTQKRNIVSFTANPAGSSNCASSPTLDQESAFQAIDHATIAIFAKEGREASLSGDGGNVTLVRG